MDQSLVHCCGLIRTIGGRTGLVNGSIAITVGGVIVIIVGKLIRDRVIYWSNGCIT